MLLYDILKNKKINVDSIDINIKNKIINYEVRPLTTKEYGLTSKSQSLKTSIRKKSNYNQYLNEFKSVLSKDDNILPLYDINNNKIFLIKKKDIYYLIDSYKFRPLNDKLIIFIINNKLDENHIIDIINLFDFDILEELIKIHIL